VFGLLLQSADEPTLWGNSVMDIVYDSAGHLVSLTGPDKVRHHVLKGILTGRSSTPTGEWGTTVPFLVGAKQFAFTRAAAAASVANLVQEIQLAQSPALPDDESVASLDSVNVSPAGDDPTVLRLLCTVALTSGDIVEVEHRFPQVGT